MAAYDTSRQGRHGEARFTELCQSPAALIGAVVNKSDYDEHGWDHVIDLTPPPSLNLPADLKDHFIQCFAQIKTTSGSTPVTRVKLTNAIKAVKSPNPTFVFLFHHHTQGEAPSLYGRHLWKEDIERVLKRARHVSVKSPEMPLHKVQLTLNFSEQDRIDTYPSDWMFQIIRENGEGRYSKNKLKLIETVGYEEFTHRGSFSIPSSATLEDIVLHELGLLDDLPVVDFKVFDQRFGIQAALPEPHFSEGRISISREPKPVTIKLISEGGRDFEIFATARAPSFIAPDNPEFKIRIDAGCIDMVASPHQPNQSLNFSLALEELGDFSQKIGLMCILAWGRESKLRYEAYAELGKLFEGEIGNLPAPESWMLQHAEVGVHLADLLGAEKVKNLQISHSEFQRCVHDMYFASVIATNGSLRFSASFDEEVEPFDHLIGYGCTAVGDWSVGAIYQMERKAHKNDAGRQTFYFSKAIVVRKFVFKQTFKPFKKQLFSEFKKIKEQIHGPTAVIMDGDLAEWFKVSNANGSLTIDVE